ncbi:MAG: flavin reductase family protein [Acidimicrobiia bacterium]
MDPTDDARTAFHHLIRPIDYPMFVVTVATEDELAGCLIGFTTQASIDPPRQIVCLSEKNRTFRVASSADHLALHFLNDSNHDLARLFGEETGDDTDKFNRCEWRTGPGGVPVIPGTNGWVVLRIIHRSDGGDHRAHLGDVVAAEHEADRPPLTFQAVRHLDPGHDP